MNNEGVYRQREVKALKCAERVCGRVANRLAGVFKSRTAGVRTVRDEDEDEDDPHTQCSIYCLSSNDR